MTVDEYVKQIRAKSKELERLVNRSLPIKVGAAAKRHYQDNFRKSGFVNNGLHPWQKSKRQLGKGPDAGYKTLLSRERVLFNNIKYNAGQAKVKIYNNMPYALIHNEGGIIRPTVTPKMRRFAWAKFYESTGAPKKGIRRNVAAVTPRKGRKKLTSSIYSPSNIKANSEAMMWKGMALTRKSKLTIKMPKRQFMGKSKELNDTIATIVKEETSKILNI